MTVLGMDAWVTSAVGEKEVKKAIVLAGSLRRVCTSKKLVLLTTCDIYNNLSVKSRKLFDLVTPLKHDVPNGLSLADYAKIEAFSLLVFNKCVYLSPNTVALKNCDEIFEKYGTFAACDVSKNGMDSSVFLFTPSLDSNQALREMAESAELGSTGEEKGGKFGKVFTSFIRNNIPGYQKLDEKYNAALNLRGGSPKSLSAKVTISNFGDAHPIDLFRDGVVTGVQLGPIEKFAMELCRNIYDEEIESKHNIHPAALSLQPEVYKTEPIAIVGMSFRLPGGNNVDEFWDLLINGRDAITKLPDHRWTREHTNFPCQDREVRAGFLSVPVHEFDAKFFGINGPDGDIMDPQQRLLLEVAWESLEDAMMDPVSLRGTQAGIFVGSWLQDYRDMTTGPFDMDFIRHYLGTSLSSGAAKLSHFFQTTGPSIGTESACSSAVVAVDMACKSLRNRDSNLALACGVNLLLKPFQTSQLKLVVSPDAACKTFDEGANGFARAEGCAVLLLKRLSDAVRDENNIWGLIRGTAVTQEGVSKSMGTPTVHCESLAMDLALSDGHVDPLEVSYVEAHGTGTQVGDPLEVASIAKTYSKGRSEPLLIGSVKTNVGHTESVSGITGIIKVLLSMKHERIPPHLHFTKLNPAINLDMIPAKIPLEAEPWPKLQDKPRIAGVSSFGISGTDGHVIVQEAPPKVLALSQIHEDDIQPRPLHVMKISAKSKESLQDLLTKYENIFNLKENEDQDGFADMAYSANTTRTTFNHRVVIIAKDFQEATKSLQNKSFKHAEVPIGTSPICFLFTGQGSQYPNMGANLYATSPVFKSEFDKCDQVLRKRYGINLREVLWGQSRDEKELSRTLYSQTSIFCIEYCLLRLWESWGVKPDFVMGHSLGEFAAAVAAGVLDFEDGLMLVAERSRLIDSLPRGKMLVIRGDKEAVDKHIEEYKQVNPNFWVDYAALNAPDQTVVAGDSQMIEEFAKFCGGKHLKTIVLAATHAFHSRHMEPMMEAYRKVAQTVKPTHVREDALKYISGMEGKLIDLEHIDSDYWVRHTREPVRFIDACKSIQSEGCSLFLEVGPHPVLSALTSMNIEGQSLTFLPSIRKKEQEWTTMLDSLSKLYLSDWKGQVDWNGFDRYYKRSRLPLPFYPFNRKPIWKKLEGVFPTIHPLLGKPLPAQSDHTIFESKLTLKNTPFTQDHVIGNTVVFPGAAFLEMCLSGGYAAVLGASMLGDRKKPQRPVLLKSLRILSPFALYDSEIYRLQTNAKLDVDDNDQISYSMGVHRYAQTASDQLGEWVTHSSAKYLPVPGTRSKSTPPHEIQIQVIQDTWEKVDSLLGEFYEKLPEIGLTFGPKFRSLETAWKSDEGLLISVRVPEDNDDGYLVHPVVADAMIQASMMWSIKDKVKMKLHVPIQIEEFLWLQSSDSSTRYIYCSTSEEVMNDCILLDEHGSHLARMSGVEFVETSVKLVEGMIRQQDAAMPKLWREVWKSAPWAMQSAYDFTPMKDLQLVTLSPQQAQTLAEINDTGEYEKGFHQNLHNMSRLYFLRAMYELGWEPQQGSPFTLEELVSLLLNPLEHFPKYIHFFLRSLAEVGMLSADPSDGTKYHFNGPPPTRDELEKGLKTVVSPEDSSRPVYQMVVEVGRNLPQILLGHVDPLQVLFPENPAKLNVGQLYTSMADYIAPASIPVNAMLLEGMVDTCYNHSMKSGANPSPPVLRMLEVGAGTGCYSEHSLAYFDQWGKPFEYHFTDVSASFFGPAEKKFEKITKNMIFKKFNMEEDPLSQGYCPNYFDVIVAAEVLHVSKDIRATLRNLRTLLKPGGIFQIVETTQQDPRNTLIFGLLEGFWNFQDLDLRPHHVNMSAGKWEQALREIGCDQVFCTPVYNDLINIIVARYFPQETIPRLGPLEQAASPYSWLIFHHDSNSNTSQLLRDKLTGMNRDVRTVIRPDQYDESELKEMMRSELSGAIEGTEKLEGVVYLWGLSEDGTLVRDQSKSSLPFVSLAQSLADCPEPPRLYVVTQGAATADGFDVTNPTTATLHGITKSIVNEATELHVRYLDLSPDEPAVNQVENLFYELWSVSKGSGSVAFRRNERLGAKFVSARVNNNEPLPLPSGCDRFQLRLPETRMISDLEFDSLETCVLEENEIEIQVKAVALNFRDVFAVLKPIAQFENLNIVGLEIAGVVTKVGGKVASKKIGDRVIGVNMGNDLSLPSHIKMEDKFVLPLPESFTYAEGVTLPAAFSTAVQCLIDAAKMKKGDSVLIHTASGGVGLCAVQLAKSVGAEIIATAGSKRKQNYLRNLGIKHVFHSRTTQFGQQILEVTNGRGVDIVLNSITGEGFKEASLSALAKNGRFIEMSKLNVWRPEEVKEMRPDVFYQIVDLTQMSKSELRGAMEELKKYFGGGNVSPIPYECFDAVNIRGALNYMQKAKHIGKVVCMMPEVKVENSKITATTPLFNEFSTYLVTGGLGGIGLEVVKWMLGTGAKHVAIAGRRPPKPEVGNQIEAWNRSGKHVEAFSVDVGDYDQCRQLFQELALPARGFPQIRGVIHGAGVLSDALMENQTWEKFNHTYHPKVYGTWNLHDLTKDLLLEHFVLFSSLAATVGSPGQSNHCASNSFEDALVSYRKANGLPATTINWGNWGEVGVATEIDFPGVRPITTAQGILALETILRTQESHITVANFDSFTLAVKLFPNLKNYLDDKRLFGETKTCTIMNGDAFWKAVDKAESREGKVVVFKDFIKSLLRNILKLEPDEFIDDHMDFQSLGVDSLMMIEMKNGLQSVLNSRINVTANQLKECSNIEELTTLLVDTLLGGEEERVKDEQEPSPQS